ncbi:hypothetical protein FVEG_16448 [Fusarium verticillioides 7600]|uniref:Rhodopsin domain-containing protein n=1 Tax=Gibberella moniliformis (strain M3125 / FGSC 7600) TaxID=334819 RepID=W7MCM6_GIBM7|nr:hypothetical protein FVEG_16448 [Fusarium verticillioides 7600]EWG49248.1 hypothetical protein FVEG_16448 [Fusarium verticillioides 7600]
MPIDPSGSTVVATEWALISVATAVILARLYLRLILQRRSLLASDVFMCAAWVSAVALASFDIYFFRIGIFKPGTTFDLAGFEGTAEEAENFYKLYYFSSYPFYTTFYFSKAALLAVYLQIFPSFMVKRRRFLWAVIVYVAISFIITILLLSLSCLPVWRNWTLSDQRCTVKSIKINFEISWVLNISSDILIFILPWLVIPELTLRRRLRYSLYATFLLGLINIIFCVVRFAQIQQYGGDLVITISLVELWSFIDACIGLIIACLPSLRPFFNWREKIQYYGQSSGQDSKAYSSHNSRRPMVSSDPGSLSQPSNVHLSEDMQRRFSVA